MRSGFVLSLAVTFVGMSLVADKGALFVGVHFLPEKPRGFTGIITEFRPNAIIRVANQHNEAGLLLALRRDTVYDGHPGTLKPGVRVTVWLRNIGERRLAAERVRVLDDGTR